MAKRKFREQDNLVKLVREEDQHYVKNVRPVTPIQAEFLGAMESASIIFAAGPAGTGKTYLACVQAADELLAGKRKRIVITRPAVTTADENLGYLPGSLEDKLNPFLRPCIQVLCERLSRQRFKKLVEEGVIEFVSFAHMRGRTFHNAFIIADEVQNVGVESMKMLLTRIGFNSRMVLCGDLSQSDLPAGTLSGMQDAMNRFSKLDTVKFVTFTEADVVRSEVVADLLACY